MNILIEGGIVFMLPLLILLITVIVLFVKGLKNNTDKNRKLLNSIGLFSLVFGVLGFVIGLTGALEAIAANQASISSQVLAGGLKVALISPTFGMIIFLLGRLFSIILVSKKTT